MNLKLEPIKMPEQVEWLRQQRNRPELFKYFRQDKPITPKDQMAWWLTIGSNPHKCRAFLVYVDGFRVGYVGFLPFNAATRTAEFGMFIMPEHQGKGYGATALLALLKHGFEDLKLSHIKSDVLDYPGENRFEFYKKLGFQKREPWLMSYSKGDKRIQSIGFYMSKDTWDKLHGQKREGVLESAGSAAVGQRAQEAGQAGAGLSAGPQNINPPAR